MKNTLKKRIMRRVYVTWFIRKATPAAGELAGFGVLGFWGLKFVSPVDILINSISATDSFRALVIFYTNAFNHLSAPAQFALVAGAVLAVVVIRDVWLQLERLVALRQKLVLAS